MNVLTVNRAATSHKTSSGDEIQRHAEMVDRLEVLDQAILNQRRELSEMGPRMNRVHQSRRALGDNLIKVGFGIMGAGWLASQVASETVGLVIVGAGIATCCLSMPINMSLGYMWGRYTDKAARGAEKLEKLTRERHQLAADEESVRDLAKVLELKKALEGPPEGIVDFLEDMVVVGDQELEYYD